MGGRGTVLIVEDEENNAFMLQAVLSKIGGYEPTVASTYEQACELLATQRFDVVLSDLDLQNKKIPHNPNGYDLCRHVYELGEKSGRKMPFVMLTGTVLGREKWMPENFVEPYATLTKGCNIDDITSTLDKAILAYRN